jgi:hypothetical protein
MTEEHKAKFWELISAWVDDGAFVAIHTGHGRGPRASAVDAYVSELIAEAYQAGRADERKAVRLWGVK